MHCTCIDYINVSIVSTDSTGANSGTAGGDSHSGTEQGQPSVRSQIGKSISGSLKMF